MKLNTPTRRRPGIALAIVAAVILTFAAPLVVSSCTPRPAGAQQWHPEPTAQVSPADPRHHIYIPAVSRSR